LLPQLFDLAHVDIQDLRGLHRRKLLDGHQNEGMPRQRGDQPEIPGSFARARAIRADLDETQCRERLRHSAKQNNARRKLGDGLTAVRLQLIEHIIERGSDRVVAGVLRAREHAGVAPHGRHLQAEVEAEVAHRAMLDGLNDYQRHLCHSAACCGRGRPPDRNRKR
jgi:hypothetical protein